MCNNLLSIPNIYYQFQLKLIRQILLLQYLFGTANSSIYSIIKTRHTSTMKNLVPISQMIRNSTWQGKIKFSTMQIVKTNALYHFSLSKHKNSMLNKYQMMKKNTQHPQLQINNHVNQNQSQKSKLLNDDEHYNQTQLSESKKNTPLLNFNAKIKCQGCSTHLQSQNPQKYGYISAKILNECIDDNSKYVMRTYGLKAKERDENILNIMHEVEKETGIKIFNEKNNEIQNLDNVDVLMKIEQKIDKFEQKQQLKNRSKKQRKQILCFRCFCLKHHNRLPEQYDTNQDFTKQSTQFMMNKILNRSKGSQTPMHYFFVIDVFDILGTFNQQLFSRLLKSGVHITLIINKIDIINKQYIDESAIHVVVKNKLKKYLQNNNNIGQKSLQQMANQIKIFFISCNSRDGIKKLKEHIDLNSSNIQLIGMPNTGKTTLLNILARLKKSVSKIPGTTTKISEHQQFGNQKRKIYDMPGIYSEKLLYNLISKPSLKSILTPHKKYAPGLLTHNAIFYGGKVEISDTRIIIFGQGGACQSSLSNRWFMVNCNQFWKGLPHMQDLHIKKYQFQLQFVNGKTDDLEIAGYGFIGFRLCLQGSKKTKRKLTLYLPQNVHFGFRPTVLSKNNQVFHNKSALTKKFMLERLTVQENKRDNSVTNRNQAS